MLPLNFTPFPALDTARLHLRHISAADAPELFFLRSDVTVMQFLDRAPATSIEEITVFIQNINNLEKTGDAVIWAITLKDTPKLIGTIGFWNIQKTHYRAEIDYVLHPPTTAKA